MINLTEEQIMKNWQCDIQNPLVSVRCITYNHEHYIAQALDGFLMQKTNFPFEVIVHDDASTDKTADIIREYEKKYPHIIKPIYQTENQYSKRDCSIGRIVNAACKGKYMSSCEGDDYWIDENKLQMQVDFLEKNSEYGMCYTKANVYIQKEQNFRKGAIGAAFDNFDDLLLNGNRIPTLTTVCRRELVDRYWQEIQPGNKGWLMGDYPLWLYFAHESKVKFFNHVTSVYRVLEESASHSRDINNLIKFEQSVYDIKIFFLNKYNLKYKIKINTQYIVEECISRLVKEYDKHVAKIYRQIYSRDDKSIKHLVFYLCSFSKLFWQMMRCLVRWGKTVKNSIDKAVVSSIRIKNFKNFIYDYNFRFFKRDSQKIYLDDLLKKYDDYKLANKKIVLLFSHDLNLTGAPIALYNFAKRLKELDFFAVIISPHDGELTKNYLDEDIPVIICSTQYIWNIINRIEILFDVIIANTVLSYPLINSLAKKNIPIIWWIHESPLVYTEEVIKNLPKELCESVKLYAVGERAKGTLLKYRPQYVINQLLYLVPEKINKIKCQEELIPQLYEKQEYIKFIIIGDIANHKGQDIVVAAINQLPQNIREKSVFVFVGKVCDKLIFNEIEAAILKYPKNVINLGVLKQDEIAVLYKQSDCLICSSREDSMPIVVTEAMMYSKIVICSENAGSVSFIDTYNSGFIYYGNNSSELCEKICYIVNNIATLDVIRQNARKNYEEVFSAEAFDKNVKAIMEEIS